MDITVYDHEVAGLTPEQVTCVKRIVEIVNRYTQEMEGYSYYGSNPGVSVDDYVDIAKDIVKEVMKETHS